MFNITLMDAAGEKGVAAFTAINYLNFILMACIIGMSEGIRSIISYNHGMGNPERIAKTLKLAARVTGVIAIVTFTSFAFFGRELVSLFFNAKESDIVTFAAHGTAILAFAYLFNAFNILIAGYFPSMKPNAHSSFRCCAAVACCRFSCSSCRRSSAWPVSG